MPHLLPSTERQKLGNYLSQSHLEQMFMGLQATLGTENTPLLVEQVGEQLGRRIARDWQLGQWQGGNAGSGAAREQLPLLLEAALGPEGHGLCRVRQAYCDDSGWQIKARLPKYQLMRTFTGGALRGLLCELLGQNLTLPEIRPDGLLLSHLSFTVAAPQAS